MGEGFEWTPTVQSEEHKSLKMSESSINNGTDVSLPWKLRGVFRWGGISKYCFSPLDFGDTPNSFEVS